MVAPNPREETVEPAAVMVRDMVLADQEIMLPVVQIIDEAEAEDPDGTWYQEFPG
jgi:hypothetical protein